MKSVVHPAFIIQYRSPPAWGRELKYPRQQRIQRITQVAPRVGAKTQKHPAEGGVFLLSGDQIFVTILMPGPMVDAVTQDLMYWPFAAAGLALMIAPMSAL